MLRFVRVFWIPFWLIVGAALAYAAEPVRGVGFTTPTVTGDQGDLDHCELLIEQGGEVLAVPVPLTKADGGEDIYIKEVVPQPATDRSLINVVCIDTDEQVGLPMDPALEWVRPGRPRAIVDP